MSECVRGKGGDGLAREEEKEVKSISKDLDLVYKALPRVSQDI